MYINEINKPQTWIRLWQPAKNNRRLSYAQNNNIGRDIAGWEFRKRADNSCLRVVDGGAKELVFGQRGLWWKFRGLQRDEVSDPDGALLARRDAKRPAR